MNTPTLNELFLSIQNDIKARFELNSLTGKVVFNAFAAVQAAKLKILYLTAEYIYRNIYPDQADPEALGGTLERFGMVKLNRLPFSAIAGEYEMTVTGTPGAVIKAGSIWRSTESSTNPEKMFTNDYEYILANPSIKIQIRALDAGTGSKLLQGDSLQITTPLIGIDEYAYIASTIVAPTDAESVEEYRNKIIEAYQIEPQGGSGADYRVWSADAEGVRKVYPYAKDGAAGEIDVYVEANPDDSTDGYGTPSQAILDDVQSVIDYNPDATLPDWQRGRRPLGVYDTHTLPIVLNKVDIQIYDLTDVSFLSQITDAIEAYLFDVRPFVDSVDNPSKRGTDVAYLSDIFAIVKSVIGTENTFTNIVMLVNDVEYTFYRFKLGNIPYLNSVTEV